MTITKQILTIILVMLIMTTLLPINALATTIRISDRNPFLSIPR